MLKPLPIGIQTFRDIIQGGFLYVDKTRWIYEMVRYSKGVYFLARPRRFGKSLLISTLHELFLGNREFFKGLWIDSAEYEWRTYPVIRFDFSLFSTKSAEQLRHNLFYYLKESAKTYQLTLSNDTVEIQLAELIEKLSERGPVVILIDEYDKPLIDNITNLEVAKEVREVLKGFYTVIKAMDASIRFVFLTGISKFSKVGVFSGLNNLLDISFADQYSTMLGMTQSEVESVFTPYITEFAHYQGSSVEETLAQIKHWYNGFRFSAGGESVYNPFSLLQLLYLKTFRNYWFESGTPTFLLKLIEQQQYNIAEIDTLQIEEIGFSSYEIDDLNVLPLLYQTGYLTIKGYDPLFRLYQLGFPNYEVENAFLSHLLSRFSEVKTGLSASYLSQLVQALQKGDFDKFFAVLNVFFADIPYDLQMKAEKYYQTIFYLIFKLIGLRIQAEVRTNKGRIDAVVELAEGIYLFEFKLNGSAEEALAQIHKQEYARRYALSTKKIVLMGANFDTKSREVAEWIVKEGV